MPINKPTVIPPHPLIDRAPPGDLPWPEPPTDDLGTRLAWAAALAGLLSLAPLLLWLVKLLIDWGMVWPALIVCGALAGVLTGIGWIVQRIRLDMRAARWYAGARRRAVSSRLDTVAAFWDAT